MVVDELAGPVQESLFTIGEIVHDAIWHYGSILRTDNLSLLP
jgi:hypothetical protein